MNVGYFMAALQILTESLPISSSTHLMLLEFFTGPGGMDRYFDFLLHIPTVIILLWYLAPRIYTQLTWRGALELAARLAISTLVTVLMYPAMKLCAAYFPVTLGLVVTTGLLYRFPTLMVRLRSPRAVYPNRITSEPLILDGYWRPETKEPLILSGVEGCSEVETPRYLTAIILGCAQGLALLPGISRLATTIVVGLWCGLRPEAAFYYACALEIPLFAGAGLIAALHYIMHPPILEVSIPGILLVLGACVLAYYALRLVHAAVVQNKLYYFGWYTGALALVTLMLVYF